MAASETNCNSKKANRGNFIISLGCVHKLMNFHISLIDVIRRLFSILPSFCMNMYKFKYSCTLVAELESNKHGTAASL